MSKASDFKKIGTKGYKAWRILSASGAWGQVYRDREKMLRGYNSAIIFPEQLIGLNQTAVFQVIVTRTGGSIASIITVMRNFVPRGVSGEILDTLKKIREYESNNDQSGGVHRISVGEVAQNNSFYNHCYFSSQKDAIKYQAKLQAHYLSQSG